jgi:hypothetical protein
MSGKMAREGFRVDMRCNLAANRASGWATAETRLGQGERKPHLVWRLCVDIPDQSGFGIKIQEDKQRDCLHSSGHSTAASDLRTCKSPKLPMEPGADEYERDNVHQVYEQIAAHFSSTRYKVQACPAVRFREQ